MYCLKSCYEMQMFKCIIYSLWTNNIERNTIIIFRWEDAKGAYLKFINKLIMGHTEIFSYKNTHIHPITHNHSL